MCGWHTCIRPHIPCPEVGSDILVRKLVSPESRGQRGDGWVRPETGAPAQEEQRKAKGPFPVHENPASAEGPFKTHLPQPLQRPPRVCGSELFSSWVVLLQLQLRTGISVSLSCVCSGDSHSRTRPGCSTPRPARGVRLESSQQPLLLSHCLCPTATPRGQRGARLSAGTQKGPGE